MSQAGNLSSAFHLLSCWFLAWLILQPWRWRHVSPKRQFTFNGLHGTVSQKTDLFTTLNVLIGYSRQHSTGVISETNGPLCSFSTACDYFVRNSADNLF
jgi:hypothetical protein